MDVQTTLFGSATGTAPDFSGLERRPLTDGAWVDVCRGWLPEADEVFATMVREVPWRAERRKMYDRVVDVPRLVYTYMIGEQLPHPALEAAREALSDHYQAELGERFRTAGCCYYRDGRDSVAWHGDRIGRGNTHDTMVAIVSVGDPRRLALRPRAATSPPAGEGGGTATAGAERSPSAEGFSVEMGHGDLVVMGGSCQRTWEHAVPKVAGAGPRLSVQFRPFNVF